MSKVLRFAGPRLVDLVEREDPPLGPHEVRLRTLYSGISAGTELTAYRGTNPHLTKRWDPESRMFVPGATSLEYPLEAWGYEEVGEVAELGPEATRVKLGDVVWGTWGHRAMAVVHQDWAAERRLEPGADPLLGVFSRIGAIALNAVHDADIHVGESVAVFGLGVPGQLVAQLARLSGAEVLAVDGIDRRLELARRLGAHQVLDFRDGDAPTAIRALTGGRGADVSLEVTGSYKALHDAIRATAYSSRVVAAGFFQGEGNGLFLGEEFHHNRIEVVCSQTSGVSPRLDHRWDRPRLERTVMRLASAGRLELPALISHVIAAHDAAEAFRLLDERPHDTVQVVLDFREAG